MYTRIRNQIDSLVETDPTAFYSYEEYETAAEMLYETIKLRAESIEGQLGGTIPSTDSGQRQNSSSLIDASAIDVKAMGQFNMGGSTGLDFSIPGRSTSRDKKASAETSGDAGEPVEEAGGDMSETTSVGTGKTKDNGRDESETATAAAGDTSESMTVAEGAQTRAGRRQRMSFSGRPGQEAASQAKNRNLIIFGICLAISLAALSIFKCYKRKN